MSRLFNRILFALCLLAAAPSAAAQDELAAAEAVTKDPLPPETPTAVFIRGGTVWTQDAAGILENADVLIVDGKISRIGRGLAVPPGALVIDAAGKHVTPGLIDCHSHSAVEGFGVNEGGNAVTSEVRIRDVLDPTDRYIYLQLAGGLTAANVLHGSANAIGGQNAVIKLRWGVEKPTDLIVDDAAAGIKFALGENPKRSNFPSLPGTPRRYPQTRMGVEAIIRNHFRDAKVYQEEWERYNNLADEEKEHEEPPRRDLRLEALVEVLDGERLVHSHSYRADEILMLIRLADEIGFKVRTFQHVLEGYRVADEIAAHGAGGSTFSDWWAYKLEAYEAIPYNAALMTERGVVVSLNSDDGNLARRLNLEAAKTVRYGGMERQAALAMVTNNPARQLKIDGRTGSLRAGKDADVVVWSGDPLSVYSRADYTLVDGKVLFSRERDLRHRQEVQEARARLADAIRNEGKKAEDENSEDETEAEDTQAVEADESQGAAGGETDGAEASEQESAEPIPTDPAAPELSYSFSPLANRTPIAIVGATVHTIAGEDIPNGVVVFDDGRITRVGGSGTGIPRNARRVDASGKHLWPGIVHLSTVLGLNEIDSVAGSVDTAEMGDWNAEIEVSIAVRPASEHIPVARSGGITHAIVSPQGGTVSGTTSLMRLDGWTWEEMSAVRNHSLALQWPGSGGGGFAAFFGPRQSLQERRKAAQDKVKEITEFFDNAGYYAAAKRTATQRGTPFEIDPHLDAMIPVVEHQRPLYVSADEAFAIKDAVDWALERGLRIVIVGGRDAWRLADYLAERQVPVVLTSTIGDPQRDEPYDVFYSSASKLAEAGVLFAIAGGNSGPGGSANIRNVTLEAGVAAGFGLGRQEAYKSVTLNPARILGVDGILGSIAVGKSASLVLTDGDLLEQTTKIEQVWIDGAEPDMIDKHKRLYEKYRGRPKPSRQ